MASHSRHEWRYLITTCVFFSILFPLVFWSLALQMVYVRAGAFSRIDIPNSTERRCGARVLLGTGKGFASDWSISGGDRTRLVAPFSSYVICILGSCCRA